MAINAASLNPKTMTQKLHQENPQTSHGPG